MQPAQSQSQSAVTSEIAALKTRILQLFRSLSGLSANSN